ncbi:MAG: hypothetical protein ACK40X_13745 [Armatimonadota bacterium]
MLWFNSPNTSISRGSSIITIKGRGVNSEKGISLGENSGSFKGVGEGKKFFVARVHNLPAKVKFFPHWR